MEKSAVRILRDGVVVGAGVLIDRRHILTCRHVADNASAGQSKGRRGPVVDVDFPLTSVEKTFRARALTRRRPKGADVALLRLTEEAPVGTDNANWAIDHAWGDNCRVFGFPAGRPKGVWAEVTIRAMQGDRLLQVDMATDSYVVEAGFSGSCVWQDKAGALGIVVSEDSRRRAAYVLPWKLVRDQVQAAVAEQSGLERLAAPMAAGRTRRRGTPQWQVEWLAGDALTQLLHDLVANETRGLQREECDSVKTALGKIVNQASGLGETRFWRDSIAYQLEAFLTKYAMWNDLEGEGIEKVPLRREALSNLRQSRYKIAHKIRRGFERGAFTVDVGIGPEIHAAFLQTCTAHPQVFRNLSRALRRNPQVA